MSSPRWAVEAHGLVKTFGDHRAVDGVDLQVEAGTVYGVLGPNGAGKTTSLRMLASLLRPDGGTATVFGRDVVEEAHAVRQLMGMTGQYATVDESLSATENLVLFGRLLGLGRAAARRRSAELLEEFGLADVGSRPLKNFSGGMRRRLDLAASLVLRPPLLFLDEPTTGLDPRTRTQVWETVRRLVAEGSTVLLTTQYLEEADQLSDRIAVIDRGRVVAEGTVAELKSSVGSSTLHLALADPDDTGRAAAAVAATLGTVPTTGPDGTVSAPMSDADAVTDLLLDLRTAGIRLSTVSVQQPSLDDVFFAITGEGVREDDEGAAGPDGRPATDVARSTSGLAAEQRTRKVDA